jgi:hypothetical protein
MVETPSALPVRKKKLEDEGTRFEHLGDFQEHIATGILAMTNVVKTYNNPANQSRKEQLETVLRFIAAYQESLALDKDGRNYAGQRFDMNRLIDANVPTKEILAAIRAEVKAKPKVAVDKKKEDDEEGLSSV